MPDVSWQDESSAKLVIWWMDAGGKRVAGAFLTPDATAGPWIEVVGPR